MLKKCRKSWKKQPKISQKRQKCKKTWKKRSKISKVSKNVEKI